MNTYIVVTFQKEIFHSWEDAPAHREYLKDLHRHIMHIKVKMQVFHLDREVELHDFKQFCYARLNYSYAPGVSCEMIAQELTKAVQERYGKSRAIDVEVFEDGEVGAVVSYTSEEAKEYTYGSG